MQSLQLPLIAIVGRPNAGKSTLFNRLLGRPAAIIEDQPGVTRDRLYGEVDYDGFRFILVDTGGLDLENEHSYMPALAKQASMAIDEADAIVFMADAKAGVTPQDHQVANLLRRSQKPVFLAINKIDSEKREVLMNDFWELGFDHLYSVSASHGLGIGELFEDIFKQLGLNRTVEDDELADKLRNIDEDKLEREAVAAIESDNSSPTEEPTVENNGPVRIAIVGRPNVGKSSLVNALLGQERVVVANMPGTTRDAIDSDLEYNGRQYTIIDTAGLRKKNNIEAGVERFAVVSALRALERADVAVMVFDTAESFGEQDYRIMSLAAEKGCGLVIALNKWDLVPNEAQNAKAACEYVGKAFPALSHVPVVITSALKGRNINAILDVATKVADKRAARIPTSELNRLLESLVAQHSAPTSNRRRSKFFFITQVSVCPLVFVISVSNKDGIDDHYKRYLINGIRNRYQLGGVPIRLIFRQRGSSTNHR